MRSFYYGSDAQLYTGSSNFSTKISATPSAYGFTAAQATAYAAADALWAAAYQAAIDPTTRTKAKIAEKNSQRAAIRKMAADYAKFIYGTPTVTDEQKIELGLALRVHPTPTPPPDVRPGMDLLSVSNWTVDVHIHDSTSSKRGKPAGCAAAWVYTFIGANYPADPAKWSFQGAATKSTFQVVFDDSVPAGTQVWLMCAWVNRRGETGPISVPITTNIQGGGETEAA